MALALGGCYNTLNVTNGGLVCGPNDACPDGFRCIKDGLLGQPGHCWKNGTGPDAATSPTDATAPKSDVANPAACTAANASPPFGPFPTCSPNQAIPGSSCDPVCQAGCACDRRCVVNDRDYATFECETSAPPASFVPVQGTCTDTLSRNCAPGSICIADDVCPWLCFKTCRTDLDCPASTRCSVLTLLDTSSQAVPNVYLCTPPAETCNPVGAATCAAARSGFNCVFMAGLTGVANTDATVCDCRTLHDKALGAKCSTLPDDCQPGAVCVDGTCRTICALPPASTGTTCPSGTCNAIYGSTRYGYCR